MGFTKENTSFLGKRMDYHILNLENILDENFINLNHKLTFTMIYDQVCNEVAGFTST